MEENVPFLTESKLKQILEEIFPHFYIIPQYKFYRRKIDYCLILNDIDNLEVDKITLPSPIKEKLELDLGSDCSKTQLSDFFEKLRIFIEFDGNYHYMNNSNVVKNNSCFEWNEIEPFTFEIRIPYWVQLDEEITEMLFGYKKDFSNNFPHGFVSKKCVLPEHFCVAGEDRLLKELSALSKKVRKEVISSLVEKSRDALGDLTYNKFIKTGSVRLWRKLFEMDKNAKKELSCFLK